MNCLYCLVPFEPKRATAQYCSSKCRVSHARKVAKEKAAEEGDPSVIYEHPVGKEPQNLADEVEKETSAYQMPEPPAPVEPCIESYKKLPVEATPLRADTNSLARQVIAGMKQRRPLTELELLEKNQLNG